MADALNIPEDRDALTADWLRRALSVGAGSFVPPIHDVAYEEIGAGVGMVGSIVRCYLTYRSGEGFAPSSVIAKQPSSDGNTRRTARQLRLYEREWDFYRVLAPVAPVRSPSLMYGDFDPCTHNFVLILEDLGHMRTADQVDGASERQAMAAIRAAGRLHGQFWDRVDQPPVAAVHSPPAPEHHAMTQSVYRRSLPKAFDLFSDQFSAPMRRLAESYGSCLAEHAAAMTNRAQTLIHGDFRLDNMFFDDGDDPGVALVDWQVSGVGSGLYDIAYFLSSSVTTEVRRSIERDALEMYREVVNSNRPGSLTADGCWRSYRQAMLACFRVPIIAGGQLDLTNERSRRLAEVFLQRTLTAMDDLDAGECLTSEA